MSSLKSILLLSVFALSLFSCERNRSKEKIKPSRIEITQAKAKEALEFCKNNGYETRYCILIDMGEHSGKKRFHVWDLQNNTPVLSTLVSHGCGDLPWGSDRSKNSPEFSNVPESHKSSLGKYKIGERGYSSWGNNVKYLLHGLESTNSNALRRVIVFHSWEKVPTQEIYPRGTPEGWGCPAIAIESFEKTDRLIKQSSKPWLMWIYN